MADMPENSAPLSGLVSLTTSQTVLEHSRVIGQLSKTDSRRMRLLRMKKNVLTSSRLFVTRDGGFRFRWAMLTLTYRPGWEWGAKQITKLTDCIKQYLKRKGIKFEALWVLELTQAGVPHYHLLIRLPKGVTLPKPDKRGWWPHGSTRIEWAKNAFGYMAKYASKGTEHDQFPKGARISGIAGLDANERLEKFYWNLPIWIRSLMSCPLHLEKIKGGFLNPETGEFLSSPYEVEYIEGTLFIKLKKETLC